MCVWVYVWLWERDRDRQKWEEIFEYLSVMVPEWRWKDGGWQLCGIHSCCSTLHDFEGPNSGHQAFASYALTYWLWEKHLKQQQTLLLHCPPHKDPSMWAVQPFPRSGSSFYLEEADLSQTRKVIALYQALDPVINLMLKCKSQLLLLGNDEFKSAVHILKLSVGSDQTDTGAASAITWLLILFPIQMCWPRNQVSMGTLL